MSAPASAGPVVAFAETDDQLLELAAVRRAADPEANPTLENLRHSRETLRSVFLVARLGGDAIGCGYVGGFHDPKDDPNVYVHFCTVPERRGRGIGSTLYRAVSGIARSRGKSGLTVEAGEEDSDSLAWLARRGFTEVEREMALALDLQTARVVAPAPPEGVEIVSRGGRGDLEQGMYQVALEAGRDIPGLDGKNDPTFDEWRAFEIERPSRRPDLCFVALASGDVVGFASLDVFGDPKTADHGLTGVARAWRGRGVATALKRSQIEAARRAGIRRLRTESVEENEPMRRLNEKLGYEPVPGMVVLRGPLLEAVPERSDDMPG